MLAGDALQRPLLRRSRFRQRPRATFQPEKLQDEAHSEDGSMLDLSSLRNPIWRPDDRLRDPAVLPIVNGYLVFYSRFSADREWSDPHAWAVACAFTSNFPTFAHDRDVTPKGFASPGDVVFWGGRWVLPYQSYPANPTHPCFSESQDLHTWHAPTGFLGEANALPWNTRRRAIDPKFVVDGEVLD